jgi:HlyD family secretion protein
MPRMIPTKNLAAFFIAIVAALALTWALKRKPKKQSSELYSTQLPEQRTIKKIVDVTGSLKIETTFKIGALVSGTIKKIFVKENQTVKKGDTLAIIDSGYADTDVKFARGNLEKTVAELGFQEKHFKRMLKLFNAGHLADDEFDNEKAKLESLKAQEMAMKSRLEKAEIDFSNAYVKAPEDGVIISIGVTEGKAITTSLDATVLFEIAGDLINMEAILDINEGDISHIKNGMKIDLSFDCHEDHKYETLIEKISYSPRTKDSVVVFEAIAPIKNKDDHLRPGITAVGEILVAQAKDALTISNQALYITTQSIKNVAKILNFSVSENSDETRKKSVWTISGESFVQKPIKLGITDETFTEVTSGLSKNDNVIVDVEEKDELEALYKKMFKKF